MISKYPFTPILGWSMSRYETFTTCKRKYYYTYYSRHDKEFRRERIELLRNLTTVPLIIGELTHEVIRVLLERLQRSNAAVNMDKLTGFVADTSEKAANERQFFERYYDTGVEVIPKRLTEQILINVESLLNSDRFRWLQETEMVSRSGWIIEPDGYGETRIGDFKAYCKVDALLPTGDEVYIFDWKTGKRDDAKHRKQLIGYAMYANVNLGFLPEQIIPILSYLKHDYEECRVEFRQGELHSFQETVNSETQEMYAFNVDVEQNIPLDKEVFSQISGGLCGYCEFKELCGRV
jgi:hypothetical protein